MTFCFYFIITVVLATLPTNVFFPEKWGYLGKHHRVVIPSCVLLRIHQEHPDEDGSTQALNLPFKYTDSFKCNYFVLCSIIY